VGGTSTTGGTASVGGTSTTAGSTSSGSKAIGLMYNGKPVANTVYCCGVFGITHKYNANDTFGTDFMAALKMNAEAFYTTLKFS